MFNIRGNYVRQTAEHRGTRHAECRTKSLTRTHTSQISGNLVMKDENNLMTLRFDDNKFDIKRNQIAKFFKDFFRKKVQSNIQHGKWVVTTIWLFVWCFPIVANKNLNVRITTSGHKTWFWWLVSPINWHSSASDEWMMKAASP